MDQKKIEEELIQKLTEGEMESEDTDQAALKRLPHQTEIRIHAQVDPVVAETKVYRRMAKEVDERYSKYDPFMNDQQEEKS